MWRWNSGLLGASVAVLLTVVPSCASAATENFLADGSVISAPRGFVDMCQRDQTFCGGARYPEQSLAAAAVPAPDGTSAFGAATGALADPSSAWSTSNKERDLASPHGSGAAALASNTVYPVLFAASATSSTPKSEAELLQRVNHVVNGRVVQETDEEVWGEPEFWQRSGVGPKAAGDCEDIAIEKRYQLIGAGFDPKRLFFAVVYLPQAGLHTVLVARTAGGDMVLDSRTPYINEWDKTTYSWIAIQSSDNPMIWHSINRSPDGPAIRMASAS